MNTTAKIHSIETCGTVDGPGIRYIIFFQGCPLRCQYCHNPDTWNMSKGKKITLEELFKDIKKYKSFMKSSEGGITASGGEPLLQTEFLINLFKLCRENKIQTALDTSGNIFTDAQKELLKYTDLVLLDIKSFDAHVFKNLTTQELAPTIQFSDYLSENNIPAWIRFVLVPNLTDNKEHIKQMAKYISTLKNIKRVDVLPFHKMGEYKWEELEFKYKLQETSPPSAELLSEVKEIFRSHSLYTP